MQYRNRNHRSLTQARTGSMQIPNWLDAEHCVPICSGNVFALDIAFYRTWRRPALRIAELSLRDRVVALASGHAIMMASSLNLYLAKPSIPVCVVGIISEAVLMVQLFRNLIEGVGDLVHATRFNQPASGFFRQLS